MKPNAIGESQEIKIKVRVNNHGILLISSATMVEKKENDGGDNDAETPAVPTEPMDGVQEVCRWGKFSLYFNIFLIF